jgi:hypothetical protein
MAITVSFQNKAAASDHPQFILDTAGNLISTSVITFPDMFFNAKKTFDDGFVAITSKANGFGLTEIGHSAQFRMQPDPSHDCPLNDSVAVSSGFTEFSIGVTVQDITSLAVVQPSIISVSDYCLPLGC